MLQPKVIHNPRYRIAPRYVWVSTNRGHATDAINYWIHIQDIDGRLHYISTHVTELDAQVYADTLSHAFNLPVAFDFVPTKY
jgi:hypothetical protein